MDNEAAKRVAELCRISHGRAISLLQRHGNEEAAVAAYFDTDNGAVPVTTGGDDETTTTASRVDRILKHARQTTEADGGRVVDGGGVDDRKATVTFFKDGFTGNRVRIKFSNRTVSV